MNEVITSMKSYSAEFTGATKSMADYYVGYSLLMFGFFAMTIILLWILSNNTATNPKLVKQLLFIIGIAYLFFGAIEFLHFFPFAAIISLLAGLFALFSTFKLKHK